VDVYQSQQRIFEEMKETIRDILAADHPDIAQKVEAYIFQAEKANKKKKRPYFEIWH
jgi:Spy/CpxP family protein refolding chaperone